MRTEFERNISVSSELSIGYNKCHRLSHTERRAILRDLGYSYEAIQKSTQNAAVARRERGKVAKAYLLKVKRSDRVREFFHLKKRPIAGAILA